MGTMSNCLMQLAIIIVLVMISDKMSKIIELLKAKK